MALKITEECISCGACEFECPNNAIFYGDEHYEVASNKCTECAEFAHDSKCKKVCPVDCIVKCSVVHS
jgi:ferredoxin